MTLTYEKCRVHPTVAPDPYAESAGSAYGIMIGPLLTTLTADSLISVWFRPLAELTLRFAQMRRLPSLFFNESSTYESKGMHSRYGSRRALDICASCYSAKEGYAMSDDKAKDPKTISADDLTKATPKNNVELTEDDLGRAAGGAPTAVEWKYDQKITV